MKTTTLGALEKLKKRKTIAMEFWKNTRNKNNTTLGALEQTIKEKTTTLGALEKSKKKKIMALKVWP